MAKKKVDSTVNEGDSGVELIDTDTNGQGRIPGTEVAVVREIQKFVKKHEVTKLAHREATDALEAENDEAIALYRKYGTHFTENGKGNFVYSDPSGAYLEIIKPSGALKVKTEMMETAASDSVKSGAAAG